VESLPIIDVSALTAGDAAARSAVAAEVDAACRRTGFFLVTGHGVPGDLLDRLDRAARAFFALPEAVKASVAMPTAGLAWRGWFPEGGELTSGRPDHKEGLYLGTDLSATDPRVVAGLPLHGANVLPDAEVPDLRPAVDAWMAAMTDLGQRLLGAMAVGLGLDADWFVRHLTADPTVLFRIFRYPALPADLNVDREGWSVGEHTDYGLLTILAHDGRPGLEVRSPDGGWISVPTVPGAFVVNLGDMLDRLTGGRYRSTPHRVHHVAAGPAAGDRLSFPFFLDPSWDATIVAPDLDGEAPADDASTRWDAASVHEFDGTYGDYLTAKVARVFPDLGIEVLPDRP
jgi:isopenicillin N synthase-like dioxygenase